MPKKNRTRRQFLVAGGASLAGLALTSNSLAAAIPDLDHERWMRRALECAQANPRAPFGAVVVDMRTAQEVASGCNHTKDGPIWHGEMDALAACPLHQEGFSWSHLALYTTAEPCSMCQSAICWAGIPLVVYGTSAPTLIGLGWGHIQLRAEEVVRQAPFTTCQVLGGVLEDECDAVFRRAAQLPRSSGSRSRQV